MNYIRQYIEDIYNKRIKLLYGGGVNINNIDEILKMQIDGVLISSDALNIEHLKIMYEKCKNKGL